MYSVHLRTSVSIAMAEKLVLCLTIQVTRELKFFVHSLHIENYDLKAALQWKNMISKLKKY
jgi:hypothetical protein